jgi:UDP-glucuronate 4-epimerase
MTILLTGGAGFIGSACLSRFLQDGEDVVVVDNFEPTLYDRSLKEAQLAWARESGDFEFIEGDVRDEALLREIFSARDISLVLHIAAVAGVRPSIEKPALYFDTNVTGTTRVLQVGREYGVEDFVLASSSSVYGGNEKTPFSESDAVDSPVSPYAASKLAMEILARTDQHLHGGNITCLRFFTVYGPRQRPQMAIHKFMRLMEQGESIPMFGDGSSGRDYTYVDDIVSGVMGAIENLDRFRIYNLGGDRVIRLRELIDAIATVVGVESKIDQLPMQPGDVMITNADISKARQELEYEPQTTLEEGLEKMWAWYKNEHRA